jgi:uncharacterized membrane protein
MVGGHAFRLAKQAVGPLTQVFPEHAILGVTTTSILAVAALLLTGLLAGLFARTSLGTRITTWFEESILGGIPQYRVLKSVTEGWADLTESGATEVVLVRADAGWQIGYVFDRLDGGWLSVFLPQAPTPLSGDLTFLPADQVRPTKLSLKDAMRLVKRLGADAGKTLAGIDLGPGSDQTHSAR